MSSHKFWMGAMAIAVAASTTGARAQSTNAFTGPSSSQAPYILPVAPNVTMVSIMTVGDSVNNKPGTTTPYRMAGIPDGLGAFDNNNGTFTVLMNHELNATAGTTRAHGGIGAFITRLTINKKDFKVTQASDLIQSVATWNSTTQAYNAPAKGTIFARFCSADLPLKYAFFNPVTGLGTNERLFMNGEETGAEGRAFAHAMDGVSYELPRLGKFSWENALAHPYAGDKTVVVGTDDSSSGQIYVYIGTKTNSGSVVERAGLTNGQLYGVKVSGYPAEISAIGIPYSPRFTLQPLGNVVATTGAQLETASNAAGVTRFLRPEDGAWNVNNWNEFFFNTTNAFNAPSRLWRLKFDDVLNNPIQGGRIDMVLNGSEGQQMLDNLSIGLNNRVVLQEDPGNQSYIAKVRMYNLNNGQYSILAQHNPALFTPGLPGFLTQDEESSGVIDVSSILGPGWYLMTDQIHKASSDPELVEGGQLQAMFVPITKGAPTNPYPRG